MRNRWLASLIVLVLMTTMVGCASSGKQSLEGTLVIATPREGENLDHIKTSWTTGVHFVVFDTVVTRDFNLKYQPGLAESWTTSPDGLVWTFNIRKDAKFHDGTPVTAQSIKWFFDTMLDPAMNSPSAMDYQPLKNTVAKDAYTFEIRLSKPHPNLLYLLTKSYAGIISQTAYEKTGPKGTNEYGAKVLVGSGPFKFKEWVPNDRLVVERNPDYNWGSAWTGRQGPPLLKQVIWRVIPDPAVQMTEFESGKVDMLLEVPVEQVDRLKKMPDVTVYQKPHFGLGYLAYATDKKPYDDVRVRKAINLAIDREAIAAGVFRGLAYPAYGYLPPLTLEYQEDKQAHRFDLDEAKKLMAQAGYAEGFKATLATLNKAEHVRVAEVLQQQLAAIGIKAEILQFDSAGYASFLKEGKQELFVREYSYPEADILQWFLASSQFPYPNHSRWQDKKTDELIDGAEASPTVEERAQKYKEAQRYLIDNAVWAPIWVPQKIQAVHTDRVKNYQMYPLYLDKLVLNAVEKQ